MPLPTVYWASHSNSDEGMRTDLQSGGVERLARFRRMDLNHVCTADTIKVVSASTPTYVCALAYASRFEMPLKIVGFRRLFESPYCENPNRNPSLAATADHLPITRRRGLYKSESEITKQMAPRWRASYAKMLEAVARFHRAGIQSCLALMMSQASPLRLD